MMSDCFNKAYLLMQNRYLQRRIRQKTSPLAGSGLASSGRFSMVSFFSPLESVFSCSRLSDLSVHKVYITACTFESKLTGSLVVESPKLVLIIGCVGLALNILSASFLHGSFVPIFLLTQRLIDGALFIQSTTIPMIVLPQETQKRVLKVASTR